MPVYFKHRRHSDRVAKRSKDLKKFLSAQDARLSVSAAAASRVLTASAIANGDTVTIGSRTYTFQDTLTNVNGNVKRSGVLATDLGNLAKAINLNGVAGTDYAAAQTIHADVSAVAGATTLTATAKAAGAAGNSIATTETGAGTSWAGATLTGGVTAAPFSTKQKLKLNSARAIKAAASAATLK